jgi:hypothetical protein
MRGRGPDYLSLGSAKLITFKVKSQKIAKYFLLLNHYRIKHVVINAAKKVERRRTFEEVTIIYTTRVHEP